MLRFLFLLLLIGKNVLSFHQRRQPLSLMTPDEPTRIKKEVTVKKLTDLLRKTAAIALTSFPLLFGGSFLRADDELAKFAAEGNEVGVDGQCFFKKCALDSYQCASDSNCLKGLACLSKCKGGSMCSTGCFAKFGSERLDNLLYCTIEQNDCVHVPRPEGISSGWSLDKVSDLPGLPLTDFNPKSIDGPWYKVMGLDSRYDCFDCQKNTFLVEKLDEKRAASFEALEKKIESAVGLSASNIPVQDEIETKRKALSTNLRLSMEARFDIPRPTNPGYLENRIKEELSVVDPVKFKSQNPNSQSIVIPNFQSEGRMFGLTFWENWYLLGDSRLGTSLQTEEDRLRSAAGLPVDRPSGPFQVLSKVVSGGPRPDMKLIFYTGHTLQGSYKGAFVYSRSPELSSTALATAKELISNAGMNPNDFCIVRNQCFLNKNNVDSKRSGIYRNPDVSNSNSGGSASPSGSNFFRFFQLSRSIAEELADWFEDPSLLSDWLISQQQRVVFENPLAVSPYADLPFGVENSADLKPSNLLKDVLSINIKAFDNLKNVFQQGNDVDRLQLDED